MAEVGRETGAVLLPWMQRVVEAVDAAPGGERVSPDAAQGRAILREMADEQQGRGQ